MRGNRPWQINFKKYAKGNWNKSHKKLQKSFKTILRNLRNSRIMEYCLARCKILLMELVLLSLIASEAHPIIELPIIDLISLRCVFSGHGNVF